MKIRKCIIPAAGWGTRFLPLTKIVHKELVPVLNKPAIDYLIQEAFDAGIEEIYLIVSPRKNEIMDYFRKYDLLEEQLENNKKYELLDLVKLTNRESKIKVIYQNEQLGLGHAISIAKSKIGNEPFAVILGDDLIDGTSPAIGQLIDIYNQTQSNVIGVANIDIEQSNKYGIVAAKNVNDLNQSVFEIDYAIEKPDPKEAPSNKAIIGRYVFNPSIFNLLKHQKAGVGGEIHLVDVFPKLMETEKIYAAQLKGNRYDLGSVLGFLKANIDFGLKDAQYKNDLIKFIKEKNYDEN